MNLILGIAFVGTIVAVVIALNKRDERRKFRKQETE